MLGQAVDARLIDKLQLYLGPILTGGPVIAFPGRGAETAAMHFAFGVFRTNRSAKAFASRHIQRFLDRNKSENFAFALLFNH